MCKKSIIENCGTLNFVPDSYGNQEMCNKAIDNYLHALDFFLNAKRLKNV